MWDWLLHQFIGDKTTQAQIDPSFPAVLLLGGSGNSNAGDEALMLAAAQACLDANVSLTVSSNNLDITSDTLKGLNVPLIPSLRSSLFHSDVHYFNADKIFFHRWENARDCLVNVSPPGVASGDR